MPASEDKRFPRKFKAVIAGSGLRASDRRESIMQPDKFKARRATRLARQSGTSARWLADKSRDWRVLVNGDRLAAVKVVMLLSARLRCRRKRHLDIGNIPIDDKRLDELPRGVPSLALEIESAEDLRNFGVPLLE